MITLTSIVKNIKQLYISVHIGVSMSMHREGGERCLLPLERKDYKNVFILNCIILDLKRNIKELFKMKEGKKVLMLLSLTEVLSELL